MQRLPHATCFHVPASAPVIAHENLPVCFPPRAFRWVGKKGGEKAEITALHQFGRKRGKGGGERNIRKKVSPRKKKAGPFTLPVTDYGVNDNRKPSGFFNEALYSTSLFSCLSYRQSLEGGIA